MKKPAKKRCRDARLRSAGAWLFLAIGVSFAPAVNAGQGVWTTNGPDGGEVLALAIDPANPSTLYAGTSGGGVFKSTNGGGNWTAINAGLTTTFVQALEIDPSNPATIYAGTPGAGVFKSTNGGESWTAINTGLTSTDVRAVAIDPANTATLYAGTTAAGVFKSTNGGGTWKAVNAGLTVSGALALAIDPLVPATLYASTGDGVFKSSDGGGSWTLTFHSPANTYVSALAIDPSSNIYAGTVGTIDWPPSYGGLFRSTDGGATWTGSLLPDRDVFTLAIDPSAGSTLYAATGAGVFKSTSGGGIWTQSLADIRPVYALVIDRLAPATIYAGMFGGVFKSMNGGESWTAINTGLRSTDVRALAIDPANLGTLYAGTTGAGVFKSANGGGSWTAINAGVGLTNTYVSALAIDPLEPATLYAGTPLFVGVFKSTNGGESWTASNAGLASSYVRALAIDPLAPATLYAGLEDAGVFKSTDGGGSWGAVNGGLPEYKGVQALAIEPSATLYAAIGGDGVFKSINGGSTWTKSLTGSFYALAIDPSAPATLYAGAYGGVYKSSNGGGSWAAPSAGLTNLTVQALAIDPTTPSTLYAGTYPGGVFRSTDSGATWAAVNAGLPSVAVNALALDPTGATTVYAGLAGGGVWQSTAPTASVTALLPTSAHSPGANGAFYTTDVSVSNVGGSAASITLKFLGHDQDGSNGPEKSFAIEPGKSTRFLDVLGTVFHQTSNFGAIRITSNSSTIGIVSVTSTPGFGGTFGQTVPAVDVSDLIPAGSSRSILYIREGDGFRSNLVLASGASVSTNVDVALVLEAGPWDYLRTRATLATKTYSVPPNGMTQIDRVVRDMGVSGPITGARLILSSSTPGAAFTGFASVIDETTNDPTAVLVQPASLSGSAPYVWLLPATAHSSGANGAFYTTNLAVANVGAAPASFTMKLLGHNQDGSGGPEQTFNLESGRSVTYFDVLGMVFSQTSNFGAIRITSDSPALNIVSVTSTPRFGGTLSQTVPAVHASDLIPAGTSRSILYIREGDGFRSNLVLASNANVSTTVDAVLVSPEGVPLATKSYSVPPNGMTQISRVVRDMGVPGSVKGARLVLSSSTPGAAFTSFASVIDEVTNDPTTLEAR